MEDLERQEYLQAVTKRLVSFTGVILLILAIGLYGLHSEQRSFLVTLVFAAGLLGGFVSIQQRLPKIKLQELQTLSTSWVSITLIRNQMKASAIDIAFAFLLVDRFCPKAI